MSRHSRFPQRARTEGVRDRTPVEDRPESARVGLRPVECDRCGHVGAVADGQFWKNCLACRRYFVAARPEAELSQDDCDELGIDTRYDDVGDADGVVRVRHLTVDQRVQLADARFAHATHAVYRTPPRRA